jgi:selenocysteine lyase/cysteine desulfurase
MGSEVLEQFSREFFGLRRSDPVFSTGGEPELKRRVYLDTTATALMPRVVWRGLERYLEAACANSHTHAHRAGRDTTVAIEQSRDAIGRLVGYDANTDVVLFTSNGATGSVNFLARALFPPELRSVVKRFADAPPAPFLDTFKKALGAEGARAVDELLARPLVVTTRMEHHSNLLPWIEAVGRRNLRVVGVKPDGTLDFDHYRQILKEEGERVRLVAVAGVSNVTGIVNPVHEMAKLAHAAGAEILVDGAQWVPHGRVNMHPADRDARIDYLVMSGHKMYAPGSRGALVGCLETLADRRCVSDVGGGMVEFVSIEEYRIKDDVPSREEAGTPNIPGSIAMGLVAEALLQIGMDKLAEHEHELTRQLVSQLKELPGITVAGSTDLARVPRAGVVSFSVAGVHHGLVAAYLNDFHNIAVRNGCFCAQPYIQTLLGFDAARTEQCAEEHAIGDKRNVPGMVRASLGVYSTEEDIGALIDALRELLAKRDQVIDLYSVDADGTWSRKDGAESPQTFSVSQVVAEWMKSSN